MSIYFEKTTTTIPQTKFPKSFPTHVSKFTITTITTTTTTAVKPKAFGENHHHYSLDILETLKPHKMSNESSASETTPLRRPESIQNNSQVLTNNRNILANNTVAIANHNNNNIEVRLGSNLQQQQQSNTDSTAATPPHISTTMDTNKRIIYRVVFDVVILLIVGAPILAFHLWGKAYKRGFFCNDESLMHPFHESTVKSWMLYIIGLVIPIGMMIGVEVFKSNLRSKTEGSASTGYDFMGYVIPDWLLECYKKIGIFGFGAAVSQLTTDIAKYSIGRLRPHFFAVCQPRMGETTCADPINAGRYIEDFTCSSLTSTARMLKEVRLSFPSGHSSFTFYTMVYAALYLQSRMTWRGSKLLRPFLQFLFIMTAWYTALSRVSDYKHHWSDVLAGTAIGSLCAVIVAKYLSDLFLSKTPKSYMLPRTNADASNMSSHTALHHSNGN